jgi:hypothetical protein
VLFIPSQCALKRRKHVIVARQGGSKNTKVYRINPNQIGIVMPNLSNLRFSSFLIPKKQQACAGLQELD